MSRLEKLRKELGIAIAMQAEIRDMINIDIDEKDEVESERLYKFLKKTTEKISDTLNKRLNKLDNIISEIIHDIGVEKEKETAGMQIDDSNTVIDKEPKPEEEDGITEFEKMIQDIFADLPVNVKVVKIPRD